MSLTIAGRLFTGPFTLEKASVRANQDPAVYAVVIKRPPAWDPQFVLTDVGETGEAGVVFGQHPARAQWEAAAAGNPVAIYLHTMPRAEADPAARQAVVAQLREAYPEPNMVIRG
jgi:hypothetical protein